MIVPDEFKRLADCFCLGIDDDLETPEEWAASAVRMLDERQTKVVKLFLGRVLGGNCSDADLQRIWFSTSASHYFPEEDQLRMILTIIRDTIERAPSSSRAPDPENNP